MPDLVEFLREEADDWEPDGKDYELGMRSPTAQRLRDAADEIERLGAEIDRLHEELLVLRDNCRTVDIQHAEVEMENRRAKRSDSARSWED